MACFSNRKKIFSWIFKEEMNTIKTNFILEQIMTALTAMMENLRKLRAKMECSESFKASDMSSTQKCRGSKFRTSTDAVTMIG